MSVTLTVGTNSYISVEDASSYFGERLFADTWTNAVADDKAKALIMASKKIDRQTLRGKKADADQVMEFPRAMYSYEPTQYDYGPGWYIQSAVPQEVLDATCEEALALLAYGSSKRIMLQNQGVRSFSIGGMSEALSGSPKKLLSTEAIELLLPYIGGGVVIS